MIASLNLCVRMSGRTAGACLISMMACGSDAPDPVAPPEPIDPPVGQTLFLDHTSELPSSVRGQCMDASVGDADGDGDLDLALAMEFQRNMLLLNDGSGGFVDASAHLPDRVHDSEEVAFADFDGDGDLDLVFVSEDDQTNELYLNDGNGVFGDASDRIPVSGISNTLAVVDLNDDGRPDLLIGNKGPDRVLINDGSGSFTDESDTRWASRAWTQDIELADVDGDGDVDVVLANEGQNQLFLNDGAGAFTDATAERLPARIDESREVKSADVDGDGDLDLVVANVRFLGNSSPRDYLLINDGSGVFSDAPAEAFPNGERDHFTIELVDLDGDGDVDVLSPSSRIMTAGAGDVRVLLNDGDGRFQEATGGTILPASARGNGFDIAVADLDGDGREDLFICNRGTGSPGSVAGQGGRARLLMAR